MFAREAAVLIVVGGAVLVVALRSRQSEHEDAATVGALWGGSLATGGLALLAFVACGVLP